MNFMEKMRQCVPSDSAEALPWEKIERLCTIPGFASMRTTMQNPLFHGEGDVETHTRMVCEALCENDMFHELTDEMKTLLLLAAVLHDIGKVKTTRLEGDVWTSPHHASTGSQMVRTFLWRDCGLCGTPKKIAFRETVCTLIRYHMLPMHLMDGEDPERMARTVGACGELATAFNWQLLCMLAEADARGRIAGDIEGILSRVQLARMQAEEAGCLYVPFPFQNRCTKYAYLTGRNVRADQKLFDETWGEVYMLAGLPGTGKDTWAANNLPDLPMVSLDALRHAKGILPTDNQGEIRQAAQELCKEYLREHRSFIFNATNLTRDTRRRMVRLVEGYGARVHIVYLETGLEERIRRNSERADAVPESAAGRMLEKTVPPMPDEAQTVEWISI